MVGGASVMWLLRRHAPDGEAVRGGVQYADCGVRGAPVPGNEPVPGLFAPAVPVVETGPTWMPGPLPEPGTPLAKNCGAGA